MKTIDHPLGRLRSLCRLFNTTSAIAAAALLAPALPCARAANYTWNVTSGNWSTPSSWNPATGSGGPARTDYVNFTNGSASSSPATVNNLVDAAFAGSVADLTYTSISQSPYLYNVTQIPLGNTLNVINWFALGMQNAPGNAVTNYLTYGVMNGPGTFLFTGTNFVVENYASASSTYLTTAYLDLTGLTNFVFSSTNATLGIGDTTLPQTSGSFNVRGSGNLLLAAVSNSISAATINVGTCTAPQGGLLSTLVFGPGTNILNVGTLNLANQKNPANALFAGTSGGLRIRGGTGGTSRATILIGNRNVGSGTGTTPGQMLINGHLVDILAGTLTVGEVSTTSGPSGSGNGGEFGTGLLQFDTGVVDATNLVMGQNLAPNAAGGRSGVVSTVTVGANALLRVGTGGLTLINQTLSNAVSSTLTISNGTLLCNGNITAVTNAADGTGAASQTNLIQLISGGTLTLGSGCFAGTTNAPIGQLNLDTNSVLRFVAPPNNQPAIAVNTLVWPANDSALTLVVSNLPPTATVGTTIPLINFATMTGGSFTAPIAILPAGVTGTLAISGNNLVLTINHSIYPYFAPQALAPATLSTNTTLTLTGASTVSTIASVQLIAQTTTLGGLTTALITNTPGSGLTVSGLGTSSVNIVYPLTPNTIYSSAIVKITDANGVSMSENVGPFDTLTPALVIEAADFNYSSGQFIDTPANGGLALYLNQVGSAGVDENKGSRTATRSYYRPSDAVVIQTATPGAGLPPTLTEQKFVVAAANGDTTDTEQEVGFNSPGDWLNYTRTFGSSGSAPAGTYNVWCYLATTATGVQSSFWQVTSDPTQPNQTTNFLGNFGTASFSDNGYNNYVYVPLVDQFGNRVALTINSGQQTFKNTVVGNPNIAFYMLMPVAPVLTPQVLNTYPDGLSPYQATNMLTFVVGPAQGASIAASGIGLVVNGVDVSAELTLHQSGGIWTATFAIPTNEVFSATITVTNTAGLSSIPYAYSFDTFNANNYQWEAVDYDFSTNNALGTGTGGSIGDGWTGGLFIDNPVPSGDTNAIPNNGTIQPNSYWYWPTAWTIGSDGYGAIAHQGVDINWPTNSNQGLSEANAAYRYPDGVGSQMATDYLRYKFLVAQTNLGDSAICQYNIGYFYASNWLNYSRTFPTNAFNIWGRLAGGGGAFSGATLSRVTSGVGTSNQTTQVLGTFSDASPSGWQAYHTIPLLDGNGNLTIVSLHGQDTLRFTAPTNSGPGGGALNALYFMLTPAVAAANFHVSTAVVGSQFYLSIPTQLGHNYTVWYSPSLMPASWSLVGTAITGDSLVHTLTLPASSDQGFYRVLGQ